MEIYHSSDDNEGLSNRSDFFFLMKCGTLKTVKIWVLGKNI